MPSARQVRKRPDPPKVTPDQILRAVAHDLRNPISGILAASQYLLEDAGDQLEGHHVALLQSIQSSSALALRFIEDTLELLSIESGKLRLRFRPTNVARLVDLSAAIHRPLAENQRICLDVRREGAVPVLNLDPLKMTQAISALLTNALKYSGPGGRIEVLIAARADGVAIAVRDQGPGQATGEVKTLLENIQSGRLKRGFKEARTALTLAAVKRIVEGHHGAIQVEGDVEKGSTFTLTLPLPISRDTAPKGAGKRQARSAKKTLDAS